MPKAISDREKRKQRRDKKKPKAENYRKGGRPIYFDFFRSHMDLDALIQQKLDLVAGKTDEESQNKESNLMRMQCCLPKKIPLRDGHPPLTGERDHYYLQFFRYLTLHIESGRYNKGRVFNWTTNTYEIRFTDWKDAKLKELMGILYYFDMGPDDPFAVKPRGESRQTLQHNRRMKAKRKMEEGQ